MLAVWHADSHNTSKQHQQQLPCTAHQRPHNTHAPHATPASSDCQGRGARLLTQHLR